MHVHVAHPDGEAKRISNKLSRFFHLSTSPTLFLPMTELPRPVRSRFKFTNENRRKYLKICNEHICELWQLRDMNFHLKMMKHFNQLEVGPGETIASNQKQAVDTWMEEYVGAKDNRESSKLFGGWYDEMAQYLENFSRDIDAKKHKQLNKMGPDNPAGRQIDGVPVNNQSDANGSFSDSESPERYKRLKSYGEADPAWNNAFQLFISGITPLLNVYSGQNRGNTEI